MADPVLTNGQYSIGLEGSSLAFVYGGRQGTIANNIEVGNTSIDTGSMAVQDQPIVGHDGQLFGVDTQPGMVITQTGQAHAPSSPAGAMDAYSNFATAWNLDSLRLVDGAVACLRAFYPGSSVVRRCYGRGRKILPVNGLAYAGVVPYTAQFQAADQLWYSDKLSQIVMNVGPTIVPAYGPPITPPTTPPYQFSRNHGVAQNTGPKATFPVVTFIGPLQYPSLTFDSGVMSIAFNGVLTSNDTLVIDSRPWARTILMNGSAQWQGQRVAGLVTGTPIISLQLQPGNTKMTFLAGDFFGKGRCVVAWRSAFLMIGGST